MLYKIKKIERGRSSSQQLVSDRRLFAKAVNVVNYGYYSLLNVIYFKSVFIISTIIVVSKSTNCKSRFSNVVVIKISRNLVKLSLLC